MYYSFQVTCRTLYITQLCYFLERYDLNLEENIYLSLFVLINTFSPQ